MVFGGVGLLFLVFFYRSANNKGSNRGLFCLTLFDVCVVFSCIRLDQWVVCELFSGLALEMSMAQLAMKES